MEEALQPERHNLDNPPLARTTFHMTEKSEQPTVRAAQESPEGQGQQRRKTPIVPKKHDQ